MRVRRRPHAGQARSGRHRTFDLEEMKIQVRFALHTARLMDVVGFYRDGLGLLEIGRFENHDGYDGVFLAVPGTDAHLEFTSGGNGNAVARSGNAARSVPR